MTIDGIENSPRTDKSIKAKVTRTRSLSTYLELRHGSKVLLEHALTEPAGSRYFYTSVNLMLAFTFEAMINQIGDYAISFWETVETLSWRKKFSILCKHLEIEFDPGCRPFQTVSMAFTARNQVAHGQPQQMETTVRIETGTEEELRRRALLMKWEELANKMFCKELSDDVNEIAKILFAAANIDLSRIPRSLAGYSIEEIVSGQTGALE